MTASAPTRPPRARAGDRTATLGGGSVTAGPPSEVGAPAAGSAVGEQTEPLAGRVAAVVGRVVSHAAVWAAVLVPSILELARGWRPTGDDANISLRAFEVFSRHSPTVGIFATGLAATGHRIYDLGPVGSWLLSIPVRIDPGQGVLWGGALWCGAALSLSVEALWRYRGWLAGMTVPVLIGMLSLQTVPVFANLPWNAYFGLIFFIATIALAWVVGGGRLSWWPWLVLTATVATQSHLVFAATSVVLALVAPAVGWYRRRPTNLRWIGYGAVVALVGWTVPLLQEVRGHPGNMTALADNAFGLPVVGLRYGLRMLTVAARPKPIWASAFPNKLLAEAVFVQPHGRALFGLVVVATTALVTVVAWCTRRLDLAMLALISTICCLGVVLSLSSVQQNYLLGIAYLVFGLWVIGALLWLVAAWAIIDVIGAIFSRFRYRSGSTHRSRPASRRSLSPAHPDRVRTAPWPGVALMAALAVTLVVLGSVRSAGSSWTAVDAHDVTRVEAAALAIEGAVPRPGPVAFQLRWTGSHGQDANLDGELKTVASGVVYRLSTDGWQTGLSRSVSAFFDPPGQGWPLVVVTLHGDSVRSVVVTAGQARR